MGCASWVVQPTRTRRDGTLLKGVHESGYASSHSDSVYCANEARNESLSQSSSSMSAAASPSTPLEDLHRIQMPIWEQMEMGSQPGSSKRAEDLGCLHGKGPVLSSRNPNHCQKHSEFRVTVV